MRVRELQIKSWGSRGAAALFVLVVSAMPALAEVCDKGDDIPLRVWMLAIPVALMVWLAVCWYFRVWQVYLGLAILFFMLGCLVVVDWFDSWNSNDPFWQTMLREGCVSEYDGLYLATGMAFISLILILAAKWLHRRLRQEESKK